jgi:hypothetical protein
VKAQYDKNQHLYGQAEERDASHILIAAKPDANENDKAAAKKKAEELAAQAKANPAKFAEPGKTAFAGSGIGPARRRARHVRPRQHGEAVRRCGVLDESRRHRRSPCRPISAIT